MILIPQAQDYQRAKLISYMMPLRLPYNFNKSKFAISDLSLTPSHLFTNQSFDFLIPDIISGKITGFESVNDEGLSTRTYLGIGVAIGYYRSSSLEIDAMKHSTGGLRTLPSIYFQTGMVQKSYFYTFDINPSHL